MVKAPAAEVTKSTAEDKSNPQQLTAESARQGGVKEELRSNNRAFELQLHSAVEELNSVKAELKQERELREKDLKELQLLREELSLQKVSVKVVSEELESLSYSISHDLRAPLRHVLGFSSALLEDYHDQLDASAQNFLDCIIRGGRKMEQLIEALLKLSRISRQEYQPTTVDLSQLSRQCAASLKEAAPERQVDITIADELCVWADAALLKAAVENLWDNAWKYTGKKDRATIEFGRKEEEGVSVFYLRDNGVGFDMRYADRLFGPFQRMHREDQFEGVGIGLAAVQRIIHRHGGRVWADAAVDSGATFFFTLPT